MSWMLFNASVPNRAAEYACSGSTTSIKWCGARARKSAWLGRANIQPAIHLRCIDTDDLDVRPFSQSDRGSGFARRGWAEQTDDGQWTIFRLDHSLTASYKKLGIFQLTCKRNTIECIFQNND